MDYMKVTVSMKDGRTITITSDKGKYNKITYDCYFENNVKATDGKTVINADNLDFLANEDFATIYNNLFRGTKSRQPTTTHRKKVQSFHNL